MLERDKDKDRYGLDDELDDVFDGQRRSSDNANDDDILLGTNGTAS